MTSKLINSLTFNKNFSKMVLKIQNNFKIDFFYGYWISSIDKIN